MILRLAIVGLFAVLQTATVLALRGSRSTPQHRTLDKLDDRSESFDGGAAVDADYYETDTGINPDSGDEDYSIPDWLDDPSNGGTPEAAVEVDADAGNNGTVAAAAAAAAAAACVPCTNVPTPYMLGNGIPCANYTYAYERRCGTEFGWWGSNGNPEHCQYSCWTNGVPFASQGGASCCKRDDADDDDFAAGTSGGGSNNNNYATPHNDTDPWLEEPGNGLGEGMLHLCQGDCDYDVDCAEGLVCWYEDGSGKVPGCSGTPREYWEYCIDPVALPDKNVTHSNTLVDFGNDLGAASLGHCQGDCDHDIDCVGDDICFYADGTGVVPGCGGTPTRSWEYCADPNTVKEHTAAIGKENLNSTDGYCPATLPYDGRHKLGSVDGTIANEISGMVNGHRNPNVLYVHNDRNNDPMLMAIDKSNGRMVGNWALGGITHIDYEDISNGSGPKAGVNYLHLCDIGDNPQNRGTVWIHRLPEPALTGGLGAATFYPQTLTLIYPDGPKNAESCLVDPLSGIIYIIQKTSGTSKIYRTEMPWGDGDETMNLKMVGAVKSTYKESRWGNVFTGIDISPNGRDVVLLSYGGLDYRCRDENESIEDALGRFGLHVPAYVEEPQGGEAIAFSSDMTGLYSCQESGGWSKVPLYRYPATVSGLLEGRSSAASPSPSMMPSSAPTHKPSAAPTYAPVSPAPTDAPISQAPTKAPVSPAPTEAPVSTAPTDAPISQAPTDAPVSPAPTDAPISQAPTNAPVSPAPTDAPISQAPTDAPVSPAPTDAPVSPAPTDAPISQAPTDAPVSPAPTDAPVSPAPTDAPISQAPTDAPISQAPTDAPISQAPTDAPISQAPTDAPISQAPTDAPISSAPMDAPFSPVPTSATVSGAPTQAETKAGFETRTESASPEDHSEPPSTSKTTTAQGKVAGKFAKKELKNRQKKEKEDAKGAAKAEEERIKAEKKAAEILAKADAKQGQDETNNEVLLQSEDDTQSGDSSC